MVEMVYTPQEINFPGPTWNGKSLSQPIHKNMQPFIECCRLPLPFLIGRADGQQRPRTVDINNPCFRVSGTLKTS